MGKIDYLYNKIHPRRSNDTTLDYTLLVKYLFNKKQNNNNIDRQMLTSTLGILVK